MRHVVGARRPDDDLRMSIDPADEDGTCRVEVGVAWRDDSAGQVRPKPVDGDGDPGRGGGHEKLLSDADWDGISTRELDPSFREARAPLVALFGRLSDRSDRLS